jgi:putative flippase GtrA
MTAPHREDRRKPAHLRNFLPFVFAGGVAFVVDAAVLTFAVSALGLQPVVGRVPSFLAAAVTTWLLNRRYTFRTPRPPSLREFVTYLSAMALGLAANFAVFVGVIHLSPLAAGLPILALVPATLAGMVINFLTSRRILDR